MEELLIKCPLFKGINSGEIIHILNVYSYKVKTYIKDEIVGISGDLNDSIKIIVKGSVRGEMTNSAGKVMKIEDIKAPRMVAAGFLFGDNSRLPVDIIANETAELLFIEKQVFLRILSNNQYILTNFLDIVSNKAQFLTRKINQISFKTIKGKFANYLMSLPETTTGTVALQKTQQEHWITYLYLNNCK